MSTECDLYVKLMIWCDLQRITLTLSLNINQLIVALVLWMLYDFLLIWYSNYHNYMHSFLGAYERSWKACFLYACNYEMQKYKHCRYSIEPVRNTAIKNLYLKKVPVTACDNSKIFLSFYLWLLSFYYSIRTSITVLEPYWCIFWGTY